MPYPGVNLDGHLSGPWILTYQDGTTLSGSSWYERVRQYHPNSTTNPLRADGTRHASAWRHYGGRWKSPESSRGYMQNASGSLNRTVVGCMDSAYIDPSSLQVWDGGRDSARLKALASWSERQVEYSDALRQAGQTAKMVGDLGKGMANSLFDLLEHKGPQFAANWKKLPGWYLQWLYGWKPLYDDIDNATARLQKQIAVGNTLHVILRGKWKGRGIKTVDNAGSSWGGYWRVATDLELLQRNKAVFRYDVPMTMLDNLQPTGFFGGLYEGAPYSYVLDWIAPVGRWLTALDANSLAIYFKEGTSSEVVKVVGSSSRDVSMEGAPPGYIYEMSNYETQLLRAPWNFTRTLETPWSITSRVPFRADLNLQHAAQGLSLLAVAMTGLGGGFPTK